MLTKFDGIREFRVFSTQTNEISLRTKRIRRKIECILFLLMRISLNFEKRSNKISRALRNFVPIFAIYNITTPNVTTYDVRSPWPDDVKCKLKWPLSFLSISILALNFHTNPYNIAATILIEWSYHLAFNNSGGAEKRVEGILHALARVTSSKFNYASNSNTPETIVFICSRRTQFLLYTSSFLFLNTVRLCPYL